jgi:hypothetical protein
MRHLMTPGVGLLALSVLSPGTSGHAQSSAPSPPEDDSSETGDVALAKKLQNSIGDLLRFIPGRSY